MAGIWSDLLASLREVDANLKQRNVQLFLTVLNFAVSKSKLNKTDTASRVCGDYILIFREWKRLIDRLTEKNTARWIDR